MSEALTILRFERATIESGPRYDTALRQMDLSLDAGELALVMLEDEHPRIPLADAAVGLATLTSGRVAIGGVDWRTLTDAQAAEARGRIGRVFESGGWLSNLNLADNITLAALHHGRRTPGDISDEAADWAQSFDLPGLPTGRVAHTFSQDLRRAACVRAFLGDPSLIILECPERGVVSELMPSLINATRAARARGAAVLWTTPYAEVFASRALRPTRRFRVFGARLRPVEEHAPCPSPNPSPRSHSEEPSAPSS